MTWDISTQLQYILNDVIIAVFFYWLTSRPHPWLNKVKIKDGLELNLGIWKGGGRVYNIQGQGQNIKEMGSNLFEGLFGPVDLPKPKTFKDELRETYKDAMKKAAKEALANAIDPDTMSAYVGKIIKEIEAEGLD